jgi:hypothetical protein
MNKKEIYKKMAHFSIAESGENSTAIDKGDEEDLAVSGSYVF